MPLQVHHIYVGPLYKQKFEKFESLESLRLVCKGPHLR